MKSEEEKRVSKEATYMGFFQKLGQVARDDRIGTETVCLVTAPKRKEEKTIG